jgi:pimeloyl-ACP methyl ester carboxylesterase
MRQHSASTSNTAETFTSNSVENAGQAPAEVRLPVGFTVFPGESFRAPRSWVELGYPTLAYFNEVSKGGHFAAWEEPGLFATEIRAAFKPLR